MTDYADEKLSPACRGGSARIVALEIISARRPNRGKNPKLVAIARPPVPVPVSKTRTRRGTRPGTRTRERTEKTNDTTATNEERQARQDTNKTRNEQTTENIVDLGTYGYFVTEVFCQILAAFAFASSSDTVHNSADREANLIYFLHCPEGIKTVHRWALRLLDISPHTGVFRLDVAACRRGNGDLSIWETCQGLI